MLARQHGFPLLLRGSWRRVRPVPAPALPALQGDRRVLAPPDLLKVVVALRQGGAVEVEGPAACRGSAWSGRAGAAGGAPACGRAACVAAAHRGLEWWRLKAEGRSGAPRCAEARIPAQNSLKPAKRNAGAVRSVSALQQRNARQCRSALRELRSARRGGRARTTLAAFARRYPVCKDLLSADAPAHGLGSLSSASCWRMKGGKPVARGYCRSLVVRIRAHSPSCPVAFHWGWRRPFPQDRACIVNRGWQRFVDSRRRLLRGRRPPGGAARLGPPRPELPLALAFETEDRALARAHHG